MVRPRLYRVLGLDPKDATQDAVKREFQRLARVLHPDKGGSDAEFAALREAFETLHDPKRRAVYDLQAYEPRHRDATSEADSSKVLW